MQSQPYVSNIHGGFSGGIPQCLLHYAVNEWQLRPVTERWQSTEPDDSVDFSLCPSHRLGMKNHHEKEHGDGGFGLRK